MQVTVLTTDHGPHQPETWALGVAAMLDGLFFPDKDKLDGTKRLQAEALRIGVAEALVECHVAVLAHERELLAADPAHVLTALDREHSVDKAVETIVLEAQTTPFAEFFGKPEFQAELRRQMAHHFGSVRHSERLWHAARNPGCPQAQEYHRAAHPSAE